MKRTTCFLLAWVVACAVCLVPAARHVEAKGVQGGLVTFEDLRTKEQQEADPTDKTDGLAMLELYRKFYNKPDATPDDLGYDAFRTYQAGVSEMHMKPELHQQAEVDFIKLVKDRSQDPNLYYISDWASNITTMFDSSGNIRAQRRGMTNPDLGMTGKQMYFPSEEALEKLIQLTKDTREAASKVTPEERSMEEFLRRKEDLEKQLLQMMADEMARMRDVAAGKDIYGMGRVETPDGKVKPLRFDMDFLTRYMADRGVTIPPPATTRAAAAAEEAANVQILTVKQNPKAQQDISDTYRLFVTGFDSETKRTEAEIKHDMFRLRISPSDVTGAEAQKTYDPLMTHEYQSGGGLSLPSRQPKESE